MNSCGFQRGKLTNKKVTQLDYQIATNSSSQCIAKIQSAVFLVHLGALYHFLQSLVSKKGNIYKTVLMFKNL